MALFRNLPSDRARPEGNRSRFLVEPCLVFQWHILLISGPTDRACFSLIIILSCPCCHLKTINADYENNNYRLENGAHCPLNHYTPPTRCRTLSALPPQSVRKPSTLIPHPLQAPLAKEKVSVSAAVSSHAHGDSCQFSFSYKEGNEEEVSSERLYL